VSLASLVLVHMVLLAPALRFILDSLAPSTGSASDADGASCSATALCCSPPAQLRQDDRTPLPLGQLARQPLPRPWVGPAGTASRVSRQTVPRRGAPGLIHSHRGEFGPR
jgi:hypothetical protein